jgi:hexosaminidase
MKRIFTLFVALVASMMVMAAECVIVPRPVSFEPRKGKVSLNSKSVIYVADKSLVRPATIFCSYVAAEKGLQLSVVEKQPKGKGAISLLVDKSLAQEEYLLDVTKKGIVIKGGSEQAVFYGLQSLRQLVFHAEGDAEKVQVECVTVKDKPHFGYRGGMLDVCRHFFNVDEVKKYIDILALHKVNRFHWHLTEDQGWRIEIKKYPELTKIGSVRKETVIGLNRTQPRRFDGKPYGGYFTQDEVREVVRYATERYVEVIPEIDMPGHMVAALATYPELGCTKGPYEVRTRWGIAREVLCAGRESTFEFIEGVLDEVVALFPSKYIHIGGDECPKDAWKVCPDCQKRIADEGLKDVYELQAYFMKRVENYLATKHGRSIIGWDEILEGGLSKTATVMSWRGTAGGIKAAKMGNKVVMTPNKFCYLDYANTSNREANGEPICGGGNGKRPITLRKAYSFDPYDQLNEQERKGVIGVQGNMWTEYVPTFDHVQHMILPRMAAIAEVGWSYGNKDYDDFARRMHLLRKLYDKCGYKYAPYFFNGIE